MSRRFLALAILAGILISPAVHALLPSRQGVDVVGPPSYDGAVMLRELTLEESTQQAGLIIVGRVQSQTARKVPGSIVTDITVQVEKQIKNTAAGPTSTPPANVTFTVQGGSVGQERLYVGGQPNFLNGERVLLFLRSETDRQLVQMYTSRYSLAGANAVQPEGNRTLAISEVERRMTSATGGSAVQIGATANTTVSSAPFTAYCVPWATNQMPVPYKVNDGAAGGNLHQGTNAGTGITQFNVVEQALAMWQVLPNSAVAFSIAGTTNAWGWTPYAGGTALAYSGDADNENTIAWADLNIADGAGPGVIGLNFCSTFNNVRHDSDTYVTNNATWTWDSFPDDGITANTISVKAVLGHELGHGLGMGHSEPANCNGNGAVTPTMCASIQIGADKFIQPDDQAGAANLYPLSGAAPGTPGTLSVAPTSPTSKTLSWGASSGNKFAYQIDRATPDCNATFKPLNSVANNVTTYVDDNYGLGLPGGTAYCYRVKALGPGGDSGYTNTAGTSIGAPCTNPAVTSNPAAATFAVNTTEVFTASATCGGTPVYKWWVWNGSIWTQMTQYTTSPTFNWTPNVTGNYLVAVWIENLGGPDGSNDVFAQVSRSVVPPFPPCTNPGLTSNPASATIGVNTTQVFTASATCAGTPVYKWWVWNGSVWTQMSQYTTSPTFNWTPTVAGSYYVAFWVQNAGGPDGANDQVGQVARTVVNPAACTNPGLTSNPASSTIGVNTTQVFTASATCGGTPVYKWWVWNGALWSQMTPYTTSPTFNWTPTLAGSYYVAFWVENQGGPDGANDQVGQVPRTVVNPAACTNPGLTSNPASSTINVNTTQVFTASATCGATPVYKWWVWNGSVWTQMSQYTTSPTFNWTPTVTGNYTVAFWVQNQGGPDGSNQATTQVNRSVVNPAACTNPGLVSNPNSSTVTIPGSQTFTASATCGGVPVYKWWVWNGSTWTQMTQYTTSPTFNWTPAATGNYIVAFWVQNQGGPDYTNEATTQLNRTVN